MCYSLKYAKSVKKQLKRIDKALISNILNKTEEYSKEPVKNSEKVKDPNLPERKFRVGNYRILFDLDKENKIVQVKKIAHRKEVYE
ncbi:MAG: type II toxin-antitoxin system RelE/ParE family toxin [Bacteroidetes bacterium]|nr:type II toxin-antitoxin system RelE/ParE family toxin [Bacteroidota bacterium]